MKKPIVLSLAAVLCAAQSLSAFAAIANLAGPKGKILVDHGKGFTAANAASELMPGDKIFVGKNSSVVVAYPECAVTLNAPTVFTVAAKPPCAAGKKTAQAAGTFIEPAATSSELSGAPIVGLLAFGAVATTGLIVTLTNKNSASAP